MLIVYYSLTGNVRRFVERTGLRSHTADKPPGEPFVIVTPTVGFGAVPASVERYLAKYGGLLRGVAASGNRNWGANYGAAADMIAQEYRVPIIHKFELAGTAEDIRKFNEGVDALSHATLS
ncbi:class Ib ribonucleoside-diphosphate reductase assembly flavoprotein NrdI [Paenibacillus sp. SI8]|uniref:class Ib ribonucleoside-diphosphate reductase assembly flavoprotein NrdI n=1 Tax=unclassified Paenibacillus TaxID=185978 RepID=UPI003466A438